MSEPDPKAIADRLTATQRERLLGAQDTSLPAGTAAAFARDGLISPHPTDPDGWIWSPLGLAVRAALQEPKP